MDIKVKIQIVKRTIELIPMAGYICNALLQASAEVKDDGNISEEWLENNFSDLLVVAESLRSYIMRYLDMSTKGYTKNEFTFRNGVWFIPCDNGKLRIHILECYLKYLETGILSE